MRYDWTYYVRRFVYCFGWISLCLTLVIAGLFGFASIERALTEKHVNAGVITNKAYNNGDVYESRWTFGDYTLSKKCGGQSYFYVTVSDGVYEDFWTVTQDEWQKLKIGDYVSR